LSKARANGVVRYLVEKGGLDSARLTSVGYGDSRPAASNAVEEGRAKNRRVEILLYAPQTEPSASKPELPTHAQKPDAESSSLSAQGGQDMPPTVSDTSKATGSGILSVPDPAQVPVTDGPGTLSLPDASANPSPDAGGNQDPAVPSNPAGQ
jgi:chemotaxis protein MotB